MSVKKTRSHKVWIAADSYEYDFFPQRKSPTAVSNPDWSLCKAGFRRIFGGLGLKAFGPAKRYEITITEITS